VLYHSDNVEASGFVQHLKLPHYVDFQSELELLGACVQAWRKEAQHEQQVPQVQQSPARRTPHECAYRRKFYGRGV